ncbi:DNA double-strand break repair nuclease NurA [Methanobacterium alcaliphilum]|nr:DNA double-strand break repair nuclease NurA [Methanobacterium alcaliphilum]
MLESLLELALVKRDNLRDKLEELYASAPDTSQKWVEHTFNENKEDLILSAGDGSIHKKKFLSFVFYVISAETLIYKNKLETIENSNIDIMPHHRFVEDRLRNHMSLFELKNALKSLKDHKVDYYLFDGSILGNLIRPIPMDRELSAEIKDQIRSRYLNSLEGELNLEQVDISSNKFEDHIAEKFNNKTEAMVYLESLENLLVISKLLKYDKKIVGISKTSTSNELFELDIPDMALFDRNHRKQGYSLPKTQEVSKKVKHDFPVENDFFRGLTFTTFYARLEDNKNLLKFELPYKAEEEEIENLLNIIKTNCTEGYPYLLKKAHNDVVIKKRDMLHLLRIMGLDNEITGRESVE